MVDIDDSCVWIVDCPPPLRFTQVTEKGKVVFRHKRNFVMSALVMVFQAKAMMDEYFRSMRSAAPKRYVGRDGAETGSRAAGAPAEPGFAALDMDNLIPIASRRGKVTAATCEKNQDKLRAAFAYRSTEQQGCQRLVWFANHERNST